MTLKLGGVKDSPNYNINHESEPDQSVEVDQSRAKDTSEHDAVSIADDSGAQKVATKTNNNGIGSILGNNVTSQDTKGTVAPRKKHLWNNWAVIGEAHEVSILKQPKIDPSSKNSDWRVIMPANNDLTLEVNVDGRDTGIGSILVNNVTSQDPKGQVALRKKHLWNNWAVISEIHESSILNQPEMDHSSKYSDWRVIMPTNNRQHEITLEVNVEGGNTAPIPYGVPALVEKVTNDNALEILKSIVYGGLTQSLASLTVVTSASSADATILSIVTLALANLISGLFIFVYNLAELKDEQPRRAKNETEAPVDRYNELLGQRKNFYVHAFIAIISFIVFGLMAPLVYGFSFHENGDKDLKLVAVIGVSLLCMTLLSIAKAYTNKSNTFVAYFKTVIYYVSNGAVSSVISYLAGDLVKNLLEKVPWFEPSSNFGLQVPGMSVQKSGWNSNII